MEYCSCNLSFSLLTLEVIKILYPAHVPLITYLRGAIVKRAQVMTKDLQIIML